MKKQVHSLLALLVLFTVFCTSISVASTPIRQGNDLPKELSNAKSLPYYIENLLESTAVGEGIQIDHQYQNEVEKTVQAITKLRRNPLLLGDGDTAEPYIINGLAQHFAIAVNNNGANSQGRNLWRLNLGALQEDANAAKKLKGVLTEAIKQNAVLVVDNLLQILSGEDEIAVSVRTALESGKVRFISSANNEVYREFFSKNSKLKALFQPIVVADKSESAENSDEDFVGDKISPDLQELMLSAEPDKKATVILQSDDINNSELRQILQANNVKISGEIERFNTLVLELPVRVVEQISANRHARHLSLDREVKLTGHIENTVGATAMRSLSVNSTLDGRGVGIAVLDSSMFNSHHSFLGSDGNTRIAHQIDFSGEGMDTDDPFGHGTHVAALAAGSRGKVDSNLTSYKGIAPEAKLINVRVLGSQGTGSVSRLLQALDWVYNNRTRYNIRVVNLSLGARAVESYINDPLCRAARRLVDAGVVVVAAAGNDGKDNQGNKIYGSIHSPGNDPSVITVGAANTYGTDNRADDTVTTFSSRGPTRSFYTDANGTKQYDNLIKPDLVAPGNKVVTAAAKHNLLLRENPVLNARNNGNDDTRLMYLSGTSMAAPIVAGTAALMLQANPKLTPNMVKMILQYTAQPIAGFNYFEQGAGLLNVEGAIRLARLVRQDLPNPTALGTPMLISTAIPSHVSTIAGTRFQWSGGILVDHGTLTGTNLITQYQKIYDLARRAGMGVILGGGGNLQTNGVILGGGVLFGDGIIVSNGAILGSTANPVNYQTLTNGTRIHSSSILINPGLISNGIIFGDGVILGGGGVAGNGVILGGGITSQSSQPSIHGDNTAAMQ